MRGGLTADVYIEKGVLHQPGSDCARFFRFVRSNPVVTLAAVGFCRDVSPVVDERSRPRSGHVRGADV